MQYSVNSAIAVKLDVVDDISSSVTIGVVAPKVEAARAVARRDEETDLPLYKDVPESVNVETVEEELERPLAGITVVLVLIRAVTGFDVCVLRAVAVDAAFIFDVRDDTPREAFFAVLGEDAITLEDVFVC